MLWTADVRAKIRNVDRDCNEAFAGRASVIPAIPARDILIRPPEQHPKKKGLSFGEGQARLLHDLANIELQALELCYRTLCEFPEAPEGFRDELVSVLKDESQHLTLCLDGIESLGFQWGDWPIHLVLWQAVSAEDSLLDRILIVHRYLEGSGLDAGDRLLRRLNGVSEGIIHKAVLRIAMDEIEHVNFGSRWYREICQSERRDPHTDFPERLTLLHSKLPRRIEKLSRELRMKAGFTLPELDFLEELRSRSLLSGDRRNRTD